MDRRVAGIGILFIALIAAVWVFQTPSGNFLAVQEKTIKVGYLPIASDLDLFVGVDQGFFKQRELEVEAIKFEKSPDLISALVAGQIDASGVVGIESIYAATARSPNEFKIVQVSLANSDTEIHKIVVLPNSSITNITQLAGKKVGVFPGSNMKTLTKLALKNYLDTSTIIFVELTPNLQLEALSSGQIDALVSLEPIGTLAEEKLNARVIEVNFLAKSLMNPMPTAGAIVSTKLIRENPEKAQKYAEAMAEAAQFIKNNPTGSKQSLVKWLKLNATTAEKVGIYAYVPINELDVSLLQRMADLLYENKVVEKEVNSSQLIYVH
ncbi:MAG: ABC transporter substrate-binding protein [Candidatus Micrarchaeota archaeon]|nr:ABC transporter substrate-binding protein [Candidatus Micrarchaeota archaeon]